MPEPAISASRSNRVAAAFDFDADRPSAGVQRVFEQLFDDGGGTLDDFTRGNAVGNVFREYADAGHGKRPSG